MIRWQGLAALVLLLLVSPLASATSFSFTGTFSYDTDLQYFTFTLANPAAGVTLRTWSYAGGTNADGTVIPAGGFEPLLNLYMPGGTQMNPGSSGPCTIPPTGDPVADLLSNPTTGACGDVYYPTTESFPGGLWDPGTYTVVLSSWANPGGSTLSDGFLAAAQGIPVPSNFTCQVGAPGVQGNPPNFGVDQPFCDELAPAFQNNGNWALDILGVDSASEVGTIPEPGSLSLGLLGGVLLLVGRYRRRRKQG